MSRMNIEMTAMSHAMGSLLGTDPGGREGGVANKENGGDGGPANTMILFCKVATILNMSDDKENSP